MVSCTYLLAGILNKSNGYVMRSEFLDFWTLRCEEDWNRAFAIFSYGVPIFIVDLALLGWVKFHTSAATGVLISIVVVIATISWSTSQATWGEYIMQVGFI